MARAGSSFAACLALPAEIRVAATWQFLGTPACPCCPPGRDVCGSCARGCMGLAVPGKLVRAFWKGFSSSFHH